MKFTKTLKYSAAALVASLGLVGCGNQETETKVDLVTNTGDGVTVEFWHNMSGAFAFCNRSRCPCSAVRPSASTTGTPLIRFSSKSLAAWAISVSGETFRRSNKNRLKNRCTI